MTDYKSFELPGNARLRIRSEKIVATLSSDGDNKVDIFCEGVAVPFHVEATKCTPKEMINYIWNIPDFESEEDM